VQRITVTIDDDLLNLIDELCRRHHYTSRSEAVRDLVRQAETREQASHRTGSQCVATLSYVYEHHTRDLAKRLTNSQHDHHDLSVATLHVHLDQEDCLEVAVLRGRVDHIQALADSITSQRGVRHGHLEILPAPHAAKAQRPGRTHRHGRTHSHAKTSGSR
jgi:CopG family transcriptional regulator, nickel-responsive regulator